MCINGKIKCFKSFLEKRFFLTTLRGVTGVQKGRQGESAVGGWEAAEMLRTDVQTDSLEHADIVRTNMLVVKGSLEDKIQIGASLVNCTERQ